MELKYINADKTKNEKGWVLDFEFLGKIKDSVERRGVYIDQEDIETILLTANGEAHLLDHE